MEYDELSDERVLMILTYLGKAGSDLLKLAKITGGFDCALLLSHLAGLCGLEGTVVRPDAQLAKEIRLAKGAIQKAREELKELELVTPKKVGRSHAWSYTPKTRAIAEACRTEGISPVADVNQTAPTTVSGCAISASDLKYAVKRKIELAPLLRRWGTDTVVRALREMRTKRGKIGSPPDYLDGIFKNWAAQNGDRAQPLKKGSSVQTTHVISSTKAPPASPGPQAVPEWAGDLIDPDEVDYYRHNQAALPKDVQAVLSAYEILCRRAKKEPTISDDDKVFVSRRLADQFTVSFLIGALAWGLRHGLDRPAAVCSGLRGRNIHLHEFERAAFTALEVARRKISKTPDLPESECIVTIIGELEAVGIDPGYVDVEEAYRRVRSIKHAGAHGWLFVITLSELEATKS